jgi:hypothetical protein
MMKWWRTWEGHFVRTEANLSWFLALPSANDAVQFSVTSADGASYDVSPVKLGTPL